MDPNPFNWGLVPFQFEAFTECGEKIPRLLFGRSQAYVKKLQLTKAKLKEKVLS